MKLLVLTLLTFLFAGHFAELARPVRAGNSERAHRTWKWHHFSSSFLCQNLEAPWGSVRLLPWGSFLEASWGSCINLYFKAVIPFVSFRSTFDLVFSYFTEFDEENPPDGMMCTNVSMWSDVYWTPENVSACACEIETKKEVEMKKVRTCFFDKY